MKERSEESGAQANSTEQSGMFISSEARKKLLKLQPSEKEQFKKFFEGLTRSDSKKVFFETAGDKYKAETIGNHIVTFRKLRQSEAVSYGVKKGNFIASIQPAKGAPEKEIKSTPRKQR